MPLFHPPPAASPAEEPAPARDNWSYLLRFDAELLFRDCRPLAVLRAWKNTSHAEIAGDCGKWFDYLFEEDGSEAFCAEDQLTPREQWRALLAAGRLEALASALDKSWQEREPLAYALLLDNDLPKMVEILRHCGGANHWCQ